MTSKGIDPSELHVKLFGGANVLMSTNDGEPDTVGHRNCAAARRVVEEEQLRLVASDLGGARGRVIYFSTASGEVRLRRLREPEIFTVKFQLR
jgi:chemotaxis protein CheD